MSTNTCCSFFLSPAAAVTTVMKPTMSIPKVSYGYGSLLLPSRLSAPSPCNRNTTSCPAAKACLPPMDADHAQAIRLSGTAGYHPTVWGDHFVSSSSATTDLKFENFAERRIDALKKEVKGLLCTNSNDPFDELNLINAIQRLGIAYHFEKEIEDILRRIYHDDIVSIDQSDDCTNLNTVALRFRLLRQAGYYVSTDVFNTFLDKEGEFFSNLSSDVYNMLSLYQASYLSFNGEDMMDKALDFSTKHLKSAITSLPPLLALEVERALKTPLRKSVERLETRHYIFSNQAYGFLNESLLQFAKLDFNEVQSLHQREINEISRWWNDIDIKSKLPFEIRDRVVEAYATIMGIYFEPKYSFGRVLLTKVYCMLTVLDDAFDVYGDLRELKPLTHAFERWDVGTVKGLQEHMKVIFQEVLNVINEAEVDMIRRGQLNGLYGLPYLKQEMKVYTKGLLEEATLLLSKDMPTSEEWLPISLVTVAIKLLVVTAIMNVEDDLATKEVFDWICTKPKIVDCSYLICRLIDDIATFKEEKARGIIISNVTCCMHDHGISESAAIEHLKKKVTVTWKDINQECVRLNDTPMRLLQIISNWPRLAELYYADGEDGYTNSNGRTKDIISSLLVDPIPI